MENNNQNKIKNKAIGGFVWGIMEKSLGQIAFLIISVLLARILSPEDYSIIGVANIFFAFCNVLITGGFGAALIQKKDSTDIDYATIFYTNTAISLLLYLVVFATAPLVADAYNNPLLVVVLRVLGINILIVSLNTVVSAYVSSSLKFKSFFYATLTSTIVSGTIGIIMAMNGYGVWSLVVQQMANNVISTFILIYTSKFKLLLAFSLKSLKSLFGYGWKMLISSIISVLYDEINPLIIGLRFSGVDLAYYTKGRSFPRLVDTTITGTMSSVLFPVLSKIQNEKEKLLSATRTYLKVSSYLIFPVMLGFLAVSESFTSLVLTDEWLPIVPYMQIFCVSYMFNMIQTGHLNAIRAIGRSDIILKLEIIKKVSYFIIIALFVLFFDSPILLAFTAILCIMVATVVNTYPNRKLIGYKYSSQIKDILPNLINAVIMGIIVLIVGNICVSVWILLPLQIIVGVIVYFLISIVTKNESYIYIMDIVKNLGGRK